MSLRSFDGIRSDEALQFLADRHNERNHPKRHRTGPRRRGLSAKRKARIKATLERQRHDRAVYLERVRSYWAGGSDGHP